MNLTIGEAIKYHHQIELTLDLFPTTQAGIKQHSEVEIASRRGPPTGKRPKKVCDEDVWPARQISDDLLLIRVK